MRKEVAVGKGSKDSRSKIVDIFARIDGLGLPFARNKFEYDGVNAVMGYISVGKDVEVLLYEVGDAEVDGVKRIPHTFTVGQRGALRTMLDNLP